MNKWDYIDKIRTFPNNNGDGLIDMMDKYEKNNLMQITEEEAKEFYQGLLKEKKEYEGN